MITQTIDLNMIPDSPPVVVHVDQYDHGAGRIIANLYNGDQLYTPSNATAWIQGTKPDGKGFQYSATLSGSTVTAELTEQMTAVAGNVRTQIVVNETNGRIGTFCFTLAVQKSGLPADTDMSASEYQIVKELLDDVIGASTNPPYIGENGNWWVWSVEQDQYVDSGIDASITVRIADVSMLEPNAAPYVTNSGTDTDPIFHLYIPRGYTGNGIASITKTGSVGLVDTYTISYTNGTTTTFEVTNGASGVGGGSTVVVTVNDSSFYGKSVSITDGNTTETTTFDNSGRATFTGLAMTGNLTISSNNGSSTATTTLSAPYFGNYTVELALWSATIDISVSSSALNGLTVYAKKNGVTFGSATIVNGAASIDVSQAGTYSIECTLDWNTYSTNVVVSAETTYSAILTTFAATVNLTTPNSEFYGESIAVTVDGTPITGTAFSGSGTATFTALRTGTYVFSITYGGQSYMATVTVSAESTYSAQIKMWNATIRISTTSASLYGNVIYVKKSGTTVASATFDNTGAASVMVHETGIYTVETTYGGWTYSAEFVVSAETTYSATLNTFDATLSISTTSPDLYGQTITIKKGSTTIGTTTFSSSGAASYTVHETGSYTCEVTVSGQTYSGSATVSEETTYNVTIASSTTMTVILDLTDSNPLTWATYADDAVGMTASSDAWDDFFGHYPCILDNGVELGKLKRSDFTQYEDGTIAPITTLGKDAMICFPRKGIKIEYLDANTLSVSMTDEDNKPGYSYMAHSYKGVRCDKFYLGAYKGYGSSNKLYSVSGQPPTVSQTIGTFRGWAQARGTGYEQSAFYQLIYRQVMYLLKYKAQNSQIAIGRGFVDGNSAIYGNTGYTNDKGMDWGESTGKYPMKLFGIEDFYGNLHEFIDGIYSNNVKQIFVADGNYNDSGTGYSDAGTAAYNDAVGGYLKKPNGTNMAGFTPAYQTYGSASTYFCDYANIFDSRLANYGGRYNEGDNAGVFRFSLYPTSAMIDAYYGSRLMYMHVA